VGQGELAVGQERVAWARRPNAVRHVPPAERNKVPLASINPI